MNDAERAAQRIEAIRARRMAGKGAGGASHARAGAAPGARGAMAGPGGAFAGLKLKLGRSRKERGAVARAWAAVVPEALRDMCAIADIRAGFVTIHVPNDATRYRLDRFLRSGGELDLKRACGTSLRRVRVVVGTMDTLS